MKVCFTFVGPLTYRGRLFKQIETLKSEGVECILIHGQTEPEPPDYSIYDFPIIPIRVVYGKLKILTLACQLVFARKAARVIADIGVTTVVCVALQSALSGAIAKSRNSDLHFIFDNNELSLEMIRSELKRKIWDRIHKYILKWADVVMHAERQRLMYFHRTYETSAKPFLLENLPFYRADYPNVRDTSKGIRCLYIGMIMEGRYCEEMLMAFSELKNSGVAFDLVGFYGRAHYKDTIKRVLEKIDHSHIRILPPVSHRDMYDFLASYDVGLAFYSNTNLNNYYCAPNKVYDYIQMGMPVISNDYPGLVDVVRNNKVGVCIPSVDTHHIKKAIKCIEENNMYANITDSVRRRYSWENQKQKYLQLFFK